MNVPTTMQTVPSRPTSPRGRRRMVAGAAWAAALGTGLASHGCAPGPDGTPPKEPNAEQQTSSAAPLPDAVYHTELTFVGAGQPPALLHLRFDNRTDSVSVRLHYRGWFGGERWTTILERRDSLPVPRATWRVLPTGPLRLLAGEGGEPASVILGLPEGSLRLDSRGAIGSWNSSTGQRESLRLAELVQGEGGEAGLLLSRQRARRVDDPSSADLAQYFLVSDTLGNGVLLMRDSTAPDAPITAWSWFQGIEASWSDALILSLAAPAGQPGRWSVELPEAGLTGELRGVLPEWNELPESGAGFSLFRVEGTFVLEGEPWPVQGIGVQERGP